MELAIGERVGEPGRNQFVVGECISTNALTTLHAARKVFYNYRYDEREFYEAAEDEWIDVQIRSLSARCLSDPAAAASGHELLRYEAQSVLGRLPGWFPEPLDWLEHRGEPLLVMSVPLGRPLGEWRPTDAGVSPIALQSMSELLNLLEALHATGQILGSFGPEDFVVDEAGRICCTATDRVLSTDMAVRKPRLIPRSFYPEAFAAPEVLLDAGSLDCRSDLYSWSAVFVYLATGVSQGHFSNETMRDFKTALEQTARMLPKLLRNMSPAADSRPLDEIVQGWSNAVERALAPDLRERPSSVAALRRIAKPTGLSSLFRRLIRFK